jgi:serine/threonine protein kinase
MRNRETDESTGRTEPIRDARYGTRVGNYVLQELLGKGGMALVYRAVHRVFNEPVAIKLLSARRSKQDDMRRRFLREAQAMREISARNRHVVAALDVGETDAGEPYLVMEYLTGRDLDRLFKSEGPLDWGRLAPIALQICDALATTHAMNFVHRDIKPQNCVLTGDDRQQIVKLIDFGIAKDLAAMGEQTEDGIVLGTPAYLAPEIFFSKMAPDARTDIYALGVSLYFLLTGCLPHNGQVAPPPAPSALRPRDVPAIPEAVDELVLRAIHTDPARRYQSITELADAIQASMEPPSATESHPVPQGPTSKLRTAQVGLRAIWGLALASTLGFLLVLQPPPPAAATPVPPAGAELRLTPHLKPERPKPEPKNPEPEPEPGPEPKDTGSKDTGSKPPKPPKPPTPPPLRTDPNVRLPVKPDSDSKTVERLINGRLQALRDKCAEFGSGPQLGFKLVVLDGKIEAVDTDQPRPFRECVRSLYIAEVFTVKDGKYPYSFKRVP